MTVRVATMPPGEDPDSLIRTQGVAAFEARIQGAKDFFDFQIERLAKTLDLDTPRGQAQCARKMAESVMLLTDNVLREAVTGRVSARLRMAAGDFRALLRPKAGKRPTRGQADLRSGEEAAAEKAVEATPTFERPPREICTLLKVALEDDEARQWLLGQPWEEVLHRIAGGELLGKVLMADFAVVDAAALTAFLGELPPAEEEFLTSLVMDRPFPQPLAVARGWWSGLERKLLQERQTALEAELRLPGLSPEETTRLQKEVLDLEVRLKEIARL